MFADVLTYSCHLILFAFNHGFFKLLNSPLFLPFIILIVFSFFFFSSSDLEVEHIISAIPTETTFQSFFFPRAIV